MADHQLKVSLDEFENLLSTSNDQEISGMVQDYTESFSENRGIQISPNASFNGADGFTVNHNNLITKSMHNIPNVCMIVKDQSNKLADVYVNFSEITRCLMASTGPVVKIQNLAYNIDPCFLRRYTDASYMFVSDTYRSRVQNVFRYSETNKPSFGDYLDNSDMYSGDYERFAVNRTKGYIAIGRNKELCNLNMGLLKGSTPNQPWTLQFAYTQYSVANAWSAPLWWNSGYINLTDSNNGEYKTRNSGIRFEIPDNRQRVNLYCSVNNNTTTYKDEAFMPNVASGQVRIITVISGYEPAKSSNGVVYKIYDSAKPGEFAELITANNNAFFDSVNLIGFNRCSGGNTCGEIAIHAVRVWDTELTETEMKESVADILSQIEGNDPY